MVATIPDFGPAIDRIILIAQGIPGLNAVHMGMPTGFDVKTNLYLFSGPLRVSNKVGAGGLESSGASGLSSGFVNYQLDVLVNFAYKVSKDEPQAEREVLRMAGHLAALCLDELRNIVTDPVDGREKSLGGTVDAMGLVSYQLAGLPEYAFIESLENRIYPGSLPLGIYGTF